MGHTNCFPVGLMITVPHCCTIAKNPGHSQRHEVFCGFASDCIRLAASETTSFTTGAQSSSLTHLRLNVAIGFWRKVQEVGRMKRYMKSSQHVEKTKCRIQRETRPGYAAPSRRTDWCGSGFVCRPWAMLSSFAPQDDIISSCALKPPCVWHLAASTQCNAIQSLHDLKRRALLMQLIAFARVCYSV